MSKGNLEDTINAVIQTNHYSKEEIIKFRKFMEELVKKCDKYPSVKEEDKTDNNLRKRR